MASPVRSRHSSLGGEIVPEGVLEEQSVTVSRQTRTMSSSSLQQHLQDEQSRQLQQEQSRHVEAMAQQSAAAQQLTFEQLQKFHDQQEEIVKRFSGYLQEQFQNQVQLKGDYDALRSQMEEQQQLMTAHNAILREASEKVGHQAHEIENLREVVHSPDSPRGHSRWGWFARAPPDETQDEKMSSEETDDTPHMTFAMGANTPTPPLYRGSTRQEKKAFMDSYLVYERRIRALNAGTVAMGQLRLMPLSSCIEHKTLLRICDYELQRPEHDITQEMWKAYFLRARRSDTKDYARLATAMRGLAMDITLSDAESRVTRLVADFHSILDAEDMDDFPLEEPKLAVQYLCNGLRPQPLKVTVFTEIKKTTNKHLKRSVPAFINWLTPKVQAFCFFEAALASSQPSGQQGSSNKGRTSTGKSSPAAALSPGSQVGGGQSSSRGLKPKQGPSKVLPTASAVSGSTAASGGDRKCYKCGDPTHMVFQCPDVTVEEARELVRQRRKQAVGAVKASLAHGTAASVVPKPDGPTIPCMVFGDVEGCLTPDSGADSSVVAMSLVERLRERGKWIAVRQLATPVDASGFGGAVVKITQETKLDLGIQTQAGKLLLTNVTCWISPQNLPSGMGDILLSRPLMRKLGYDPEEMLAKARQRSSILDMEDVSSTDSGGLRQIMAMASTETRRELPPEETHLFPDEAQACFPEVDNARDVDADRREVWDTLLAKISEAKASGCSVLYLKRLEKLLWAKVDVFRMHLGNDPPVDMPPLEVALKPDAVPVRCKARRYPQEHREFMRKHVDELVAAGMCYRNTRSKWCSPPLIVKKPGVRQYRMTVDVRAVNAQTQRVLWPMPMLEVILDHLHDSQFYFLLDFFKGYWQFLLALSSQELFSFLTDMGVFTPTRVLMGASDSVAYCQSTVQEMFAEFLYKGLMIWLDDLLGYHETEEGLGQLLEGVLTVCETKGLKLNPSKCSFFLREARWCGRIVSGAGVKHDPERIRALQELPPPTNGQELQQFVCALNWMRLSIPGYNKLVLPLTTLMEQVYQKVGGRTRRLVARVPLAEVGWNESHTACLKGCKAALGKAVQLAHPDSAKRLCVFTDASDLHWGAVVTQVPPDHLTRELCEQHHEPLMFLSGSFSGAATRWAIVEKEAFAIMETCKRADYLLHRPDGFALYTDHRNLRFIFSPTSVLATVPKYTADKLDRWALLLMAYDYEIHDISGEANVWADLLSRWGSTMATICAITQVPMSLSPTLDDGFIWPSLVEIALAQQEALETQGVGSGRSELVRGDADGVFRDDKRRIWIPAAAGSLQMRLCIVGHFAAAGHRGLQATRKAITNRFVWDGVGEDIAFFVERCLHCASTRGGPPVPRPLGQALHAELPNELLHWDYLYMSPAETGELYLLVLKDDASKFVWLCPCIEATAATTYDFLLEWFATFGVCHLWVSDQGTHFKNEVIKSLQHGLGAHHHFTTARSPWANGTVEVVMRDALRCFRALLSEWRMPSKDWPRIAKVVQLVLNQSPSAALGGLSPVTAMTGIPPMSPLDALAIPGPIEMTSLDAVMANQKANVAKLQASLAQMHKTATAANTATRARGRKASDKRHAAAMTQFAIGDYVLYAEVWAHTRTKLSVRWCGPAQVTDTVSNWIFVIRHLLTGDCREVHASRLKFYADSSLEINEEFLQHVAHNSEGHVVSELTKVRYEATAKQYQFLVSWRGLSAAENSWEPAAILLVDVPVMVKAYIRAHSSDPLVTKLSRALGLRG